MYIELFQLFGRLFYNVRERQTKDVENLCEISAFFAGREGREREVKVDVQLINLFTENKHEIYVRF